MTLWLDRRQGSLEVILANGEAIRLGALANQGTAFGPVQKWIHLPDLLGLFTLAAGSMGIISKVCLRVIEAKREWLHDYCYSFRRDQLAEVQSALMQQVRGEVVYDIHFTDRWQYHWPMEEGLYDKSKIPDDGWFFLKTVLLARDAEELAFKEKRMRRIYHEFGGVDVPEIADKAMGAKAQESAARDDWHSWGRTVGAARSSPYRRFAVSPEYRDVLKRVRSRRAATARVRHLGSGALTAARQLRTRDFGSKKLFRFYNVRRRGVGKRRKCMGMVQQFSTERGVSGPRPPSAPKGRAVSAAGSLYDVIKDQAMAIRKNLNRRLY